MDQISAGSTGERPDDVINVLGLVSHRTAEGVVSVEWGNMGGQFDPDDARELALHLLREAERSMFEADLFRFLRANYLQEGRGEDEATQLAAAFVAALRAFTAAREGAKAAAEADPFCVQCGHARSVHVAGSGIQLGHCGGDFGLCGCIRFALPDDQPGIVR